MVLALYLPLAVTGYATFGRHVPSDILLSLDRDNPATMTAIALQIVNLIGTYVTIFNPMTQSCEDLLAVKESKWGEM